MKQIFLKTFGYCRRGMQQLLTRPVTWLANRYSSTPNKENIFQALSNLYEEITANTAVKKGTMLEFLPQQDRIIIFSDQHKGIKNGADDFATNEVNYLAALDYYNQNNFTYINLGDTEELWENHISSIIKHNKLSNEAEKQFIERNAFYKIYGNHDSMWRFDPLAPVYLKQMYGKMIKVFAGIVLRTKLSSGEQIDIFCTHGHQGDNSSDGNWFSAWFVAAIWGPLQRFLRINPNTPAFNDIRKTLHNQLMYEWSATQKNVVLVTGHTHQPVFNSLTHLELLYLQLEEAMESNDQQEIGRITKEIPRRQQEYNHINSGFRQMKPSYFNAGCCCFNDGNITGIEVCDGFVRLVKWSNKSGKPQRIVAEESALASVASKLIH